MGHYHSKTINSIIQNHYKETPDFYTDKSIIHSYDKIYDIILKPYVDKAGSMLEIGVYRGGSLLLWQDYFSKMKITGLDVNPIVPNSILKQYHSDRIDYQVVDGYSEKTFNMLMEKNPKGFDIVIDDGPHTVESQLRCINLYLKTICKGGIFIIEDILSFATASILIERVHHLLDPEEKYYDYRVHLYDNRGSFKKRYDDLMLVVEVES